MLWRNRRGMSSAAAIVSLFTGPGPAEASTSPPGGRTPPWRSPASRLPAPSSPSSLAGRAYPPRPQRRRMARSRRPKKSESMTMPMMRMPSMADISAGASDSSRAYGRPHAERRLVGDDDDELTGHQGPPGEGPALLEAGHEAGEGGGEDRRSGRRRGPWRPSTRPARRSTGGMWSTPEMTPLAMAGAAPRTTTKVMAPSVSLNSSTASGSQAMVGIVWRPVIIDPKAARRILFRATASPSEHADDHRDGVAEEGPLHGRGGGVEQHAAREVGPRTAAAPGAGRAARRPASASSRPRSASRTKNSARAASLGHSPSQTPEKRPRAEARGRRGRRDRRVSASPVGHDGSVLRSVKRHDGEPPGGAGR